MRAASSSASSSSGSAGNPKWLLSLGLVGSCWDQVITAIVQRRYVRRRRLQAMQRPAWSYAGCGSGPVVVEWVHGVTYSGLRADF